MENALVARGGTEFMLDEIANTEKLCTALMKTKHYEKMGREGIFAIVQKASSLGIKPVEALNGGLYYVQGKVELSAIMMAKLIRQQKHSITKDKASNDTVCILHGKRADNGDTWKASFSIVDAKRAGIYNEKGPWGKYPDVMCYNRALSKLARQLFPDVIGNCYVEGEISDAQPLYDEQTSVEAEDISNGSITEDQARELDSMIGGDDEYREIVLDFIQKRFGEPSLSSIPSELYQTIYDKIAAHSRNNSKLTCNDNTNVLPNENVETA